MSSTYEFKHDHSELSIIYDFPNKQLTPFMNKINFVITHGSCVDGFMSATVVRQWLKANNINLETITFYNAHYGTDFTDLPNMMRDKYVVICDFSFPKALFNTMINTTKGNILILDHHKTAEADLQDTPSQYLTFDMKHSGAFLTWAYFFGLTYVPKCVLYVEDNDIWTKALPQTQEFTAYIYTREYEFDEYDKFFDDKYLLETVFPIGTELLTQNNIMIQKLANTCVMHFMEINNRYYFVASINTGTPLRSELGNYVLNMFKNANFSMIYDHPDSTSTSYRSLDTRTDSTEIAKLNGGGGHRNASGATLNTLPGTVIDSHESYTMLDDIYSITQNDKTFLLINAQETPSKYLVTYLMQERFINNDGIIKNKSRTDCGLPGFQEGLFCMRNKTENPHLDILYSGAIMWFHDRHSEQYIIMGKFLPGVLKVDSILEQCNEFIDFTQNVYKISMPSMETFFDKFIN